MAEHLPVKETRVGSSPTTPAVSEAEAVEA